MQRTAIERPSIERPSIELQGLKKSFRRALPRNSGIASRVMDLLSPQSQAVQAIADVSFRIEPGERVAFIGPNGAGKSTTLKVLSGILEPDAGTVDVLGMVPWRERTRLAWGTTVVAITASAAPTCTPNLSQAHGVTSAQNANHSCATGG